MKRITTNYLHWDEKTLTDFSEKAVALMYDRGYVFTRIGKGVMHQTRSVRVDLSRFNLSSENRRVLKKTDGITLSSKSLPLADYAYQMGMDAKYFYDTKFGPGIMSVQKIKEMLTDANKSNFNALLVYSKQSEVNRDTVGDAHELGYAIVHNTPSFLHYSYPFYHIDQSPRDMGLGMMIRAVERAKSEGKRYIYLGSLQRPGDAYKLQFEGLEWFDGGPVGTDTWSSDLDAAKRILS